jgi:Predicted pyridoxal phosphate-dependent enzyme apparently involved in regulation of cell wall biogenesis
MPSDRVYLSVPHMSGLEQAYVQDAFTSNWLSSVGPNLDGFEREMSERLGGGVHTLAVSSGTAALHLVLREAGVVAGDRVAVSTLTFAGSVWPILYLGAVPVFLDSEETSGNLDRSLLEDYLSSAAKKSQLPKALVVVHLYGQHADLDPIAATCARYGVTLIEDAAESLGATYRGRQTGTTADYAILSFNGNKIITTTGGGMALAKDPAAIARMKKWANQSREPAIEYVHREMGYNYRMSNVLAGIGRGSSGCWTPACRRAARWRRAMPTNWEMCPGSRSRPRRSGGPTPAG